MKTKALRVYAAVFEIYLPGSAAAGIIYLIRTNKTPPVRRKRDFAKEPCFYKGIRKGGYMRCENGL